MQIFFSSNGTAGMTDGQQGSDGRGGVNVPVSGDSSPKVTFSISNKKDKECRLRPDFCFCFSPSQFVQNLYGMLFIRSSRG